MKSTIFAIISAMALASATDVQVTLADNTDGSLSQFLTLPSGECRASEFCYTTNLYANSREFYEDGLGSNLDKIISNIAPNQGVICSLFECG